MYDKEAEVLNHLADAWNSFIELEPKHEWDVSEFMHSIHEAQNIVLARVAYNSDLRLILHNLNIEVK